MRRILDGMLGVVRNPRFLRGIVALGVVQGLRYLLEDTEARLAAVEARGTVPLDDVVTVGDLEQVERGLHALVDERAPAPTDEPPEGDAG